MNDLTILDRRADKIRALIIATRQNIIEIGRELIAAKAEVPHGQWETWLENEFGWEKSNTSARNFMRVADMVSKQQTSAVLGISFDFNSLAISNEVYIYLAMKNTPQSVRDEALKRAAEGEKITKAKIDDMIAAAVAEERKRADEKHRVDLEKASEAAKQQAAKNENELALLKQARDANKREIEKLKEQLKTTSASTRATFQKQLESMEAQNRRLTRTISKQEKELAELQKKSRHIEVFVIELMQGLREAKAKLITVETKIQAVADNKEQLSKVTRQDIRAVCREMYNMLEGYTKQLDAEVIDLKIERRKITNE